MSHDSRKAKKLVKDCPHEYADFYQGSNGHSNAYCPDCKHYAVWSSIQGDWRWVYVKPNAPKP